MQATFDNKTNLLSANVRSCVDNSILYNISTTHNLWGRTITILKDANPAGAGGANKSNNTTNNKTGNNFRDAPIVGAIYWRERLFEVNGVRRSVSDIKRKPPGFTLPSPPPPKHKERERERKKDKDVDRKRGDRKPRGPGKEREKEREREREKEKEKDHKSRSSPPSKPKGKNTSKDRNQVAEVPGCASCLSFTRRSSLIFTQLGLGDWWRSITCNTRYWRWGADRTEYELVYHHEQWKALINLRDDETQHQQHDDESPVSAGSVPGPVSLARPMPGHHAHVRTRSASATFASPPGRTSGFATTTTTTTTTATTKQHSPSNSQAPKRHSRHSSAGQFSFVTLVAGDDEKQQGSVFEDDEEMDEEKLREERRTGASLYIPYRNHLFHKTKPAVLKMKQDALLKDEVFLLLVMIYEETKRQDKTNSSGGW